jgi:hypothetical protein
MQELALVSVVAGALIIAVRGPSVLAPAAAVSAYRWVLETQARIRSLGVVVAALGGVMIVSAHGSDQGAAWVISIVGWLWGLGALLLMLVFTSLYREVAGGILDAIDDPAVVRALGVLGTLFGAFLVYLGIGVF